MIQSEKFKVTHFLVPIIAHGDPIDHDSGEQPRDLQNRYLVNIVEVPLKLQLLK